MAARLAGLIDRRGESVKIYRKTLGAVGAYGDAAETWTLQATENMLLKRFTTVMIPRAETNTNLAGRLKNVEIMAYAKGDSVAQDEDKLVANNVNWRVVYSETAKVGSTDRLLLLCLARFDE